MKGKLVLLAGAAVGYVFGTRAGRERYEQIKQRAGQIWHSPKVQETIADAESFVSEKAPEVQAKIGDAAASAVNAVRTKFGDETELADPAFGDTDRRG